jgi:polyphenol oxidase
MRVRPAAHLVDDAYIAKYQKAVELMKALPETDGRSFVAQYRLHCAYCNNHLRFAGNEYPLEIHQSWLFFTWHRLYLYFNERILAKLIDDDTFALPYWNWDNQDATNPLPNTIPRVYANNVTIFPNSINKTSSLWHPDRNPCSTIPGRMVEFQTVLACAPQNPAEVRAQNAHLLWTQAVSAGPTPLTWHGLPYRFGDYGGVGMGTMEARPHGPVHIWTNVRNMATNKDSASDPIFVAHHANVDRLWEHWLKLPGKYHKHITDPDYLNTKFTFYDENGDQVSVTVKQSLNLGLLRYKYQEMPTKWATQGAGDPSWKFCSNKTTSADDAALIASTPRFNGPYYHKTGPTTFKIKRKPYISESHGEEMLELKAKFDWHKQHLQNIFAFLPNSTYETTSIGCAEFIGNMFSFPHVGMSPELAPEMTFRIGIRRKLELMGRAHLKELVITLVGELPAGRVPGEAGFELTGARIIYSKK